LREKQRSSGGALYAAAAYGTWGLVPIYWRVLGPVPAVEVLAHRVIWSLVFVTGLLAATGSLATIRTAFQSRRTMATLALSSALISVNWGLFIWAVQSGRLLQASLGYFINPLINVLFGVIFLGERLRALQKVAVGLALIGVTVLAVTTGVLPWVSLVLAVTFGLYGLLRKTVAVESMVGLFAETALLAPIGLTYVCVLEWTGRGALGRGTLGHGGLLMACGVVTGAPLMWFTAAARRLPLSTLGFFQYVSPTCQFALAVLWFGERMTAAHAVTFALIWTGLVVFTFDAWRRSSGRSEPDTAETMNPPSRA